jgi:hypothetical protein
MFGMIVGCGKDESLSLSFDEGQYKKLLFGKSRDRCAYLIKICRTARDR